MTTERFKSVIDIEYLGTRDVDKYLADLRRLGAITEQTAGQVRNALAGGLGGDSTALRSALSVGAAGIRDYDAAANKAIATADRQAKAVARLRTEIEGLNAAIAKAARSPRYAPGHTAPDGSNLMPQVSREVRRQLYAVLQSSAINQRIAAQVQPAAIAPRSAFVAPPAPRALETAYNNMERAAAADRARFEQRILAAINARSGQREPVFARPNDPTTFEGFKQVGNEVSILQAVGAAMRPLENEIAKIARSDGDYYRRRSKIDPYAVSPYESHPRFGGLPLPAASPRLALEATGVGASRADAQRQRDLVDRLDRTLARIAASDAARQPVYPQGIAVGAGRQPLALSAATSAGLHDDGALARFNARVERAIDARPNQIPNLTFADGGRMSIEGFTQEVRDTTRSASMLDQRIRELSRALEDEEAAARRSTKLRAQAGQIAEDTNRAMLEARIAQARSMPGQSANGIPEEVPAGDRRFWQDGIANRRVLQEYRTPEERAFIIGEHSGDPLQEYAPLLKRLDRGPSVPGFVTRDDVLEELVAERTAGTREKLESAQQRRDVLPPFALPRAYDAEERLARAQERLAEAVRVRAIAERLLAAQAASDPRRTTTLYHGSANPLPERLLPANQVPMQNGQMYGRGLYMTSDPGIAGTYATIGGAPAGYLHSGRVDTSKAFDLDQPFTWEDEAAVKARAEALLPESRARLDQAIRWSREESGPILNPHEPEFMRVYGRSTYDGPTTWQKVFESFSRYDRDLAPKDVLTDYLREEKGAESLRYNGGQLLGGRAHDAYVMLKPEDLRLERLGNVSSEAEAQQIARAMRTELAPLALAAGGRPPLMIEAGNYGARVPAADGAYDISSFADGRSQRAGGGGPSYLPNSHNTTDTTYDWRDVIEERLDSYASYRPEEAKIKSLRGRASRAVITLGEVEAKGDLPLGEGDGYADANARTKAYTRAREELMDSNRALAQAEGDLEAVVQKEANQRRRNQRASILAGGGGLGGLGTGGSGGRGPGGPDPYGLGSGGGGRALPPGGGGGGNFGPGPDGPDGPNGPMPNWIDDLERLLDDLRAGDPVEAKIKQLRASLAVAQNRLAGVISDAEAGKFQGDDLARDKAYLGARGAVINAQNRLAAAEGAEAKAAERAANESRDLIAAMEQRAAAERAAAGAARRTATLPGVSGFGARGTGSVAGGGGFTADFARGFKGERYSAPYAEQLGQTFKFSVMYGTAYQLLTAFTNTLGATVQEGILFQQALTELKLAANRGGDEMDELAGSLGSSASAYGFAPSQGVLVGARSLGLYGVADGSAADQARVAQVSADVVSRLALTSGMQPEEIQTNIAAISQAFGGGIEGAYRTADLDQYFSEKFGITSGGAIRATAEAGNVGAAAGFSQDEVQAIAALMMGRTGQTDSAVGGFMAQIFSRGGEGSLENLATRLGIDTGDRLGIEDLSRIYQDSDGGLQNEIAATFGRGKVQNAVVALLEGFDEVQAYADRANTEGAGSAREAADLRMKDIGGQIRLTVGAFRDFANELGKTGLLAALGAGAIFMRELAEAGTGVLELFNGLPGPIKATVGGLLALTLVTKALAAAQTAGIAAAGASSRAGFFTGMGSAAGVFRGAGGTYAGGAAIPAGRLAVAPMGGGAPIPFASGSRLAATGAALGNVKAGIGAGAAALGLTNPIFMAIAGLLAIGYVKSAMDKYNDAVEFATDALLDSEVLTPQSQPGDYRDRAAALDEAAFKTRDSVDGFFASRVAMFDQVFTGSGIDDVNATAQLTEDRATFNRAVADFMEARKTPVVDSSAFGAFDQDGLNAGRETVTAAGGTAEQRFQALADALLGTAAAADAVNGRFNAGEFGLTSVDPILDALTGSIDSEDFSDLNILEVFDPASVARSVRQRFGDKDLSQLTTRDAKQIAAGIIDDSNVPVDEIDPEQLAKAKQDIVDYLLRQRDSVREILSGARSLTAEEVTPAISALLAETEARIADMPTTAFEGRIGAAREAVRTIEQAIANTGEDPTETAAADLAAARRLLVNEQINRLEAMRRVAQQNANGKEEVASIGRGFFEREVGAALRGGDQDKLVELVGLAGAYGKRIALEAVNDAIRVASEALEIRRQAFALFQGQLTRFTGIGPTGGEDEIEALKGIKKAIKNAISGDADSDPYATGSDVPGAGGLEEAQETAAERAAARASAYATRSESPILAAKAAIQSARASLAKAEENTVAYWSAMEQLFSAQNSLTDAILEHQKTKYLLARDITDPLVQAQAELRAAQAKLASDAGKGEDVLAADRLAVKQARANLEATKFQEQLSAVQTADRLGQISHQAYIRYLERQQKRLEGIKNKTYQEQQQLNEISGLLQDAQKTLQGQFNFGDINLPTPYQVRRYIEQASGGKAAREAGQAAEAAKYSSSNVTTIYIDGADTGKVKKIVEEVTGQRARTTTSTPRRR